MKAKELTSEEIRKTIELVKRMPTAKQFSFVRSNMEMLLEQSKRTAVPQDEGYATWWNSFMFLGLITHELEVYHAEREREQV